jgi:hypothetical protein
MSSDKSKSFREAAEQKPVSLWREFLAMIWLNKKFWMIPILIVFFLFGLLLVLSSTAAAPFIYTLF